MISAAVRGRRDVGRRRRQLARRDAGRLDQRLEPAGGEDEQHADRVVADGGPAVGDVARAEQEVPGAALGDLVADLEPGAALEHVEALVVAVVDVKRGPEARSSGDLDDRVRAVGLRRRGLDDGQRAEPPAGIARLQRAGGESVRGHVCLLAGLAGTDSAAIIHERSLSKKFSHG